MKGKIVTLHIPESPKRGVLYTVRARSIFRKSRKDEGKLGVWLVFADDAQSAEQKWRTDERTTLWVIESVTVSDKDVIALAL